MAKIEFRTEWLTQIGLAAKCGTPEEVMELCVAIQRIAQGQSVGDMSPLVELLFAPIEEAINEDRTKSERNRTNRQRKVNENERKTEVVHKEKEEREEEEEQKEIPPAPPLERQEGEEEKEEREINARVHARESETALAAYTSPLPEPAFVAETDPKKLTDKAIEEEFEALWMLYPKKQGRADALKHYRAARKNGTTYDEVHDGIERYVRHIEEEQTDPHYIAHGSSWFCGHRWEDQYARGQPKVGSLAWLANMEV